MDHNCYLGMEPRFNVVAGWTHFDNAHIQQISVAIKRFRDFKWGFNCILFYSVFNCVVLRQ